MPSYVGTKFLLYLFLVETCRGAFIGFKSWNDAVFPSFSLSSSVNAFEPESNFRSVTKIPVVEPLPPYSYSGQIERAIIRKFGAEPSRRVLDSWRLMDMGYEHREFISSATTHKDPAASFCYQHASSFVPGLRAKSFWDSNEFDWSTFLAKNYKTIRQEFLIVTEDMERLQKQGNNVWAGALSKEAGGYGEGWKTLVLMDRGIWDPTNCNLFPKTAKCVRDSGIPAVECFFACMNPNTDIKMHSDFTNFVLTSHLAVEIPENGKNKCRLTIGDDTREWINGEVMIFDTSLLHNAVNEANGERYILMFRLFHPDLTGVEKEALQFIYDCLELPQLLSDDPGERYMAEQTVESMRTFPQLKTNSAGFGSIRKGGKKGKKKKKKGNIAAKGFG